LKHLWQRLAGRGYAASEAHTDENVAGRRYPREFLEAFERTRALGLPTPPVGLLVEKDCVNVEAVTRAVYGYLDEFSDGEAIGQAFAINVNIIPYLYAETGIPFTLTMGWFEHCGKELFRHDECLLRTLMRDGISEYQPYGVPIHAWLTSPAFEVLDVTLPTTIAGVSGAKELSGGIIYISNQDAAPPWIYHPTVVGVEFLEKIGAAIPLATVRH
jgi:hypothetical protein